MADPRHPHGGIAAVVCYSFRFHLLQQDIDQDQDAHRYVGAAADFGAKIEICLLSDELFGEQISCGSCGQVSCNIFTSRICTGFSIEKK